MAWVYVLSIAAIAKIVQGRDTLGPAGVGRYKEFCLDDIHAMIGSLHYYTSLPPFSFFLFFFLSCYPADREPHHLCMIGEYMCGWGAFYINITSHH
ncbi:hypothetical protein HOY80DRAFT_48996 [Tuber brumale]|nr:hypothetical protein HOY80DRAFT_48996 [Tuber brumale]